MKIVVENIFMCLVLFWKCYFPTNFSHFLGYFLSIQTNFITENFKITAKSQHHTSPKHQFNPWQQTPAIKTNNHQNSTTTPPQQQQKSKSQREISGSKIGGTKARSRRGEIERRRDRAEARSKARSSGAVRSARCCKIERRGAIWCVRSSDWSSGFASDDEGVIWALSLSLSLSLSLCASDLKMVWSENFYYKPFPGSKPHFTQSTSNNFRKIYFSCATKHPHLQKSISRSDLKPKQTQPYFHQLSNQN